MTANTLAQSITPADVAAYRRDGYFLYHAQLFPPDKLARLTAIFEEHVAGLDAGRRTDELDVPHFRDERLLEFLLADEVLDLVEPFIGSDIGLWSSHFISKEPKIGRATPWHEDSAYWNGRISSMDGIITVWLALDETDEANGCMRVIPGSHIHGRAGFSEYEAVDRSNNLFGTRIKSDQVDESRAVGFELARGECSLHDARLIHGARANTSDRRRCGYTMRYFSTRLTIIPERNPKHRVWLGRGQNLAGSNFVNV